MAGSLKEADVLKIPRCPTHNIHCVIKTGTKKTSTNGKSFYICNNKENCSFAKPASDIDATTCQIHNEMVELKAFASKPDGIRCYYRCVAGKKTGVGWCGNTTIKKLLKNVPNITSESENVSNKEEEEQQKLIANNKKTAFEMYKKSNSNKEHILKEKNDRNIESIKHSDVASVNRSKETSISTLKTASSSSDINSLKPQNKVNLLSRKENVDSMTNDNVLLRKENSEPNCNDNIFSGIENIESVSNDSILDGIESHISKSNKTSNLNSIEAVTSTSGSNTSNTSKNQVNGSSKIIEILSSSEDEEENVSNSNNNANNVQNQPKQQQEHIITNPSFNHASNLQNHPIQQQQHILSSQLNHFNNDIYQVEQLLRKKQELYQKYGRQAPDGGHKLYADMEKLIVHLNELKRRGVPDYKSKELPVRDEGSAPSEKEKHRSPPLQNPSVIDLGYNYPQSLMNAAQYIIPGRNAPLFGGRMTETRLKEVGRVTKGAIEELHKSLETCPAPNEETDDPKGVNVPLMSHQKQALAWLLWREKQSPSGGILADDMGLGKTLTMISLILKSKLEDLTNIKELSSDSKLQHSKGTVVVCPASLVHQWHKEIEKRLNRMSLTVCLYHGTNREKRIRRLAGYDVILTTYNIVSIEGKPFVNAEKDKPKAPQTQWLDASQEKQSIVGPIFKIFWRRIILDEGHTIKNHKAAMSIAVSSLESESRWIVTGTPIQNQAMDLYSLIKFLRVTPFDELKVWKREVDSKSNWGMKRMNSIVKSILLRRTKDQMDANTGKPLVSLPEKRSLVHKIKLSGEEMMVYGLVQNFSNKMFTEFLSNRKDAQPGSHSTKEPAGKDKYQLPSQIFGMSVEDAITMFGLGSIDANSMTCLLVMILRLRQCCGHLSLMCEPIDQDVCNNEGIDLPLDEQLSNLSIDPESSLLQDKTRPPQLMPKFPSTKVKAILNMLKKLEEESKSTGRKVKSVIVSQWTRMLEIIGYHLKLYNFKYEVITGSVNAKKRSDIVERFNSDSSIQIVLISLKAGGVGLNLIGGSHLFLIDQHWNPALEDQACDRIYRVGQKNNVVIHRFLCEETVEQRIVQLQEKKKALANNVLYGSKAQKLTLDDLKTLFGITR